MMIKLKYLCLALLFSAVTLAQTPARESLIQQANRHFDTQAYAKAVALYQEILTQNLIPIPQRQQVLLNLASSYFNLGDNVKSEEFYKTILSEGSLSELPASHYLNFAKALANNGKMQESEKYYDLYQSRKLAETQQNQGAENYTKKRITYRLDYLAINTSNAEFSPMYYKDGLVFVSGKAAGAVSTESTEKGYLDLFFVNKESEIRALTTLNADGTEAEIKEARQVPAPTQPRKLGSDSYTKSTSNDSRTLGSYNGYGLNDEATGGQKSTTKSGKAVPFSKELNTRFHEGPVTFSADGSQIIFTRNNFNEGQKGVSDDNNIKLKLYSAQWGNGDWTNVQELPFNNNDYSTAHPSLSKDGSLLYFVSDMPKGMGGKDIYVSRYDNGQWSTPINLGKELNTKQDEVFPFVDARGNLYFSTAGRKGGYGGLDLYYAVLSKDGTKVIEVIHLDAPINSKADDFGLITDAARTTGYFSSNRREGDDDIYRFTRESSLYECRELLVRVFDNQTQQPLDSATITIKSKSESPEADKPLQTDANGWAHLCLASNNDFIFNISKNGYLDNTIGFSTRYLTDDKPTRLELGMETFTPSNIISTTTTETEPKKTPIGDDISELKHSRVRGIVRTETDRQPIEGVLVKLRNECDKKIYESITGPDGRYDFEIAEGCDYTLIYSKDTYGTNTVKINRVPKKAVPKVLSKDIGLLKKGDIVKLDNIYYDQGKDGIRPDAARELEKVVATMKRYPSLQAEILSHTDSRGDANFNQVLSQKRAQAVVDYMVSKGVSRNRLKPTGMGESTPVNGCVDGVICTEAEYQRNRRTEFKVLEIR
ncbi:OmpA family protein [Runella aurantiaca]|uniref:Flagellar motor protein MotB n=1 Tax=Runella aurantiaca TaxID=2282308 RepID=A0A369I5N7_9BACT|nr:OmpA family protein [Runella aurantiaca]RDB02833.1 flagellar motor protein MotB [Runella aurantiaca]